MSEPFAPPGLRWERPSPRLLAQQRLLLVAGCLAAMLAAGVLAGVGARPLSWVPLALAPPLAGVWGWLALGRAFRAWGYAERAEDLVLTHGVLVRRLTVVPFGRMQYVDVTAGPLDRLFGIATVQLHTAAAATEARVPGLLPDAAAALRDRLTAVGQSRSAGL